MHMMLVGIEHLTTGIQFLMAEGKTLTFERESPSMFRAISSAPFNAYWPVKQTLTQSTETEQVKLEQYSNGEAEWYATKAANALADIDNRSVHDMQTYTRTADYMSLDHTPSRYAPNEPNPFPWAVVKAMRRKHGKEADKKLAELRWNKDHWYYYSGSMYLGVETDGTIHS